MPKLKWVKSDIKIVTARRKDTVTGYISPDTSIFGINKSADHWVVTHLETGMVAVTTDHLIVAKQAVEDLLEINETWQVIDSQPQLTKEEVAKVLAIRSAASYYTSRAGNDNLANYLEVKSNQHSL